MNPIIKELQNIEWSRAMGPNNSLGGEMVRVEQTLARQRNAQRTPPPPPPPDPSVRVVPEIPVKEGPLGVWDWIGYAIGLALLVPFFFALPMTLALIFFGIHPEEASGHLVWMMPAAWAALLAARALADRKKTAGAINAGGPGAAHHQEE